METMSVNGMETMSVNGMETETKYELPAGAVLPQLVTLPQVSGTSGPDEQELEAEYYDTEDLRLLRAGITLRRRRGGSDAGWHLKLPVSADTRREIRLPLGRGGRRVPAKLAELVLVHTRGVPLRPIARIATRRERVVLLGQAGESLAEVATDEVSAQTMGDSTAVSQWREVEVELTGGDRRLLLAADEVLRRDGLRPARWSAKLERALDGQLPKLPAAAPLTATSTAGDVVLAYVRQQAEVLKSLDPMVRRDEPDSVHQMRVATRRLRSTLHSFGRVLRRADTAHLGAELKWLAGLLGAARDAEVLTAHLEDRAGQVPAELLIGPVQARIRGHFAPVRAQAHTALIAALDSGRYFTLLDELDQLLADPPLRSRSARPATAELPKAVSRAYRKTDRLISEAARKPAGQSRDMALHEARKAAKRTRYAGETAAPAVGRQASRFAKQIKEIQSLLGDHQDLVIARQVERDLGISAHLAGENAFTYGLLYQRAAAEGEQLQALALTAWEKASRPRYRRWMS